MKVLIIMRAYCSYKENRYGIFEWDQVHALSKLGHEVCVLALDLRGVHKVRRMGVFRTKQNETTIINISCPIYGLPYKLKRNIAVKMVQKGYTLCMEQFGKPDVIHAHFLDYGFYAACAFNTMGIPIVVTEHSSKVNKVEMAKRDAEIANTTYKQVDSIICVSNALAKRIYEKFNRRSVVIPNIVDVEIFRFKERIKNQECFTFVTVANLVPLKRIDLLMEVVRRMIEEKYRVRLVVVGDGIEKANLKKFICDYNLCENILLLGRLERTQISEVFSHADCFVLPSASETFGVAYIEALAAGLPVVATRCGGPEDFINEENGLLVDVDDAEQLYSAMIEMLQGKKVYDMSEISQKICTTYSPITVAKQIEGEYKKVIKEMKEEKEYVE